MTADPRHLIDGYFDDMLTSDELLALRDWIQSDPEHAKAFARASLLHDRLRDALASGDSTEEASAVTATNLSPDWFRGSLFSTSFWGTTASVTVLLVGIGVLWFSSSTTAASAAFRELDRIIVSSIRSRDRTYEIVVEDISTPNRRGKRSAERDTQRPPKPPLDGAILHVRDGQHFVLIRKTTDGAPFITGSNGKQSWAVSARGPVRVSQDVDHFNHDLPGHETSIPLTNLHEGFERLRQAYRLQFSTLGPEEFDGQEGTAVRMLVAVKKPKERGPQRVEIAYDHQSGRILHMRFVQMPYGPDRLDLRMSLLNENELPPDFFEHASHHTPDRTVETEN